MVVGERSVPARRAWSARMVDREAELGRLREAWARASTDDADRATGVLVHGEAGVGKSRLVAMLADEARAAGARVVTLHGSPFHLDAGLHPIRGLVEARCGIADDAGAAERLEYLTSELAILELEPSEMVPLMAPVLGIDPSAGYEQAPTEGRKLEEQVTEAVLDYVIACAEDQPAIVMAENVHWFDDATRALLADLVRTGPGRMLVLGTSRNPEAGLWEAVELQPLTSDWCMALIDALGGDLTEQARADLAARSGGIPLYLEELVRAGELGAPARVRGIAPMPGSVPEALYEPLVARLYATPAALPVAATAAAAGQQVDRALLAAAMSIGSDELDATLAALVEGQILESVAGGRYRFRHELLREVAYELQPPSWRRKVHDRLCDLLATRRPCRLVRARLALRARRTPPRGRRRLPADGGVGPPARCAGRGPRPPQAGDRPGGPARERCRARPSRGGAAPAPRVPGDGDRGRRQRGGLRRTSTAASSWPRPTRPATTCSAR